MPQKAAQCWSCLEILGSACPGIALDGGEKPHVCLKCWRRIPVSKRIMIAAAYRNRDEGGLGLAEFLAKLNLALEEAGHDIDLREMIWRRGDSRN